MRFVFSLAGLLLGMLATPAFALLPIQHWTAASGARVYFVESHEIPMLDVSVDFPAGSARDERDMVGLASLTQHMLKLGAGGFTERELEDSLADVGANLGGRVEEDRAGLTLRTLSSAVEREQAVDALRRMIESPEFPAAALEREKRRVIAAIKEAATKPDSIANREFRALIYGEHPYGGSTTVESVGRIGVADLQNFHRRYYRSDYAVVAMIGDISRAEAEALAESLTQGLPRADAPLPPIAAPGVVPGTERRIDHPASQSHILIGMPVLRRGDPDHFPLLVGNYILGGGGFVSRLMQEVREDRGLAYSVYSYFMPLQVAGPFEIGLQTKREQADEALAVVRATVSRFLNEGPSAEELSAAKQGLIGGFPLRIDNNRKILDNLAVIGFYGLPLDYLDRFVDRIAAVTNEDLRRVWSARVRAEDLITVVVAADTPATPR